jgi:hypothetical protein
LHNTGGSFEQERHDELIEAVGLFQVEPMIAAFKGL